MKRSICLPLTPWRKTVQKLLRHENIATTTKYAHVTDDDVMAAMQLAAERAAAAATQSPTISPAEHVSEDVEASLKRLLGKGLSG